MWNHFLNVFNEVELSSLHPFMLCYTHDDKTNSFWPVLILRPVTIIIEIKSANHKTTMQGTKISSVKLLFLTPVQSKNFKILAFLKKICLRGKNDKERSRKFILKP